MESEANDKQLKYKTYDDIKITFKNLPFREQMGPVNLEQNLKKKNLNSQLKNLNWKKMTSSAIKKLREAINKINYEGK